MTAMMVAAAANDVEMRERDARSVALEKTYVHDVYDQMSHHFCDERGFYRPWPRVRQFLEQLEPGCLVCDAGPIALATVSSLFFFLLFFFSNIYFFHSPPSVAPTY